MEKERFESGQAKSLINIVSVIMKLERVDEAMAKSMAYAWQLCMENEILKDLEELKKKMRQCSEPSFEQEEEWRFIDAWLLVAAGNLFTSVVMSRYGGEGARISGGKAMKDVPNGNPAI